jgi:hypothetical protein
MVTAMEKVVAEAAQELGSEFPTGLDLLVAVYRNSRFPLEIRMNAAAQAAKYQVPSLSASLTATVRNPSATAPLGIVMLPAKDPDGSNEA